jgi:mono/diheme cytochrome c family protein
VEKTLKQLTIKRFIIYGLCLIGFMGCRGWTTEKPPVHPNINFDFQPKIRPQRDPLPIPANTVPYGHTTTQAPLSDFVITEDFIREGQKNYTIYCATCHTKTGNGTKSIISSKGWVVSNILEDVTANKSDQELYDIIQNGIRTMPGYGNKLTNVSIWQVVLYVRSLQKMTRITPHDVSLIKQGKNND